MCADACVLEREEYVYGCVCVCVCFSCLLAPNVSDINGLRSCQTDKPCNHNISATIISSMFGACLVPLKYPI